MSQTKILIISLGILLWLFLLLLPLPYVIIDFVLALQLAFSFIFLLFTLSPIKQSIFYLKLPQILIMLTLLRLTLNLSTTRSILVNGYAGSLIDSISVVVLGDEWLIGLLLFAVLSVIQLIVISQGSERIAQVLARFHLDALPHAQNQIQQELQLQALSFQEGRWQKQIIKEQMDLSASLDGVMKWVKGDAIANILLLAINIIAGILVGVIRDQYALDVAILIYIKLSIGDAFLAQIPALLTSIGISVYIANLEKNDLSSMQYNRDLGHQFSLYLWATAIVIFMVALLPGVHFLPLFLVFLPLVIMGFLGQKSAIFNQKEQYLLRVSPQVYAIVQSHLPQIFQSIEQAYHLKLYHQYDQNLIANHYQIYQIKGNHLFWRVPKYDQENLLHQDRLYDLCFSIQHHRSGEREGIMLFNQLSGTWQEVGEYTAIQYLKDQLMLLCSPKRVVSDILKEIYHLQSPLKKELIPKKMSELQLAYLLDHLLQEGINLPLSEILFQALCFAEQITPKITNIELIEQGRFALKELIFLNYMSKFNLNQIDVIQIHPDLVEQAVMGIWGEEEWDILRIELDPLLRKSPYAVIALPLTVTQSIPQARSAFAKVIHQKKPYLSIFSNQELSANVKRKQIGTIGF